jgi:MoaA/NifB/PqqE/SkfB family radical SAM enzyme
VVKEDLIFSGELFLCIMKRRKQPYFVMEGVLAMEYRFPNLPELEGLSILVRNDNGRIKADLLGSYSIKTWFFVKLYFFVFNKAGSLINLHGSSVSSMYIPPIPSQPHARIFESYLAAALFDRRIPQAVTIGVTTACQFHCVHCSAKGRSKTVPVLTADELKEITRQCISLGVTNITFTGGEPLLRTDLEEIIASIPKEKAISLVFTNALGLTLERAKSLKEAGLFGVHISLDSVNPSAHDLFRGFKDAFKFVEKGVKNALEAGLLVGISTYVTRDKALNHDIVPMAELCAQWGIHEMTVFDAIQTGEFKDEKGITLNKKARNVLLKDSKIINKKYKGTPRIITQTWTNSGRGFSRFIGCLAANLQFHITAQGDFTPCDFTPLSFGNIKKVPLSELWGKILHHPAYKCRRQTCRMQDPEFRKKYIESIPEDADLPFPIDKLPCALNMSGSGLS